MNVTELARKLKVPTQMLLEKLPECGFDIGKRAIKVDDRVAAKIIKKWEKGEIKFEEAVPATAQEAEKPAEAAEVKKVLEIPRAIVINQLAKDMGISVTKIIAELMKSGIMATLNQEIDYDTAAIIAADLGFEVRPKEESETDVQKDADAMTYEKLKKVIEGEEKKKLKPRPPVVVVMGHVDHGKTKLLDNIRKTNMVDTESGGITQHIGAYQVKKQRQLITFIDTPGHKAFRAMRARGGRVADIVILVVAADDGVQPQTEESIKIIQQEKLPFIVAINKIDKPDADPDRVKRELSEKGLAPEDWGGKTICVPISAKEGIGIDDLLSMILLVKDMIDVRANPDREALGTIIESHLDSKEGAVATVLIQVGTLKVGDPIIVGNVSGKIKALRDYKGDRLENVPPGTPAKILGLKGVPEVGDILEVTFETKRFKEQQRKRSPMYKKRSKVDLTAFVSANKNEGTKWLKIILKTDVLGSEEAILESLFKIQTPEVGIEIVSRGLGNITEADVLRAEATGAEVLGFRVLVPKPVQVLAQEKGVDINTFQIIYDLFDQVKGRLEEMLTPEIVRTDLGELGVLAVFKEEANQIILGGRVNKGKTIPQTLVDIFRGQEKVGDGKILRLQVEKKRIDEAVEGVECGIQLETKAKIKVGDILKVYNEEKMERKIADSR